MKEQLVKYNMLILDLDNLTDSVEREAAIGIIHNFGQSTFLNLKI
jgi:hypothetical protein